MNSSDLQAARRPLRVGIVGCGRIARAHAEALACDSGARLAAVCDTDAAAAQRFAQECGAPALGSVDEFLSLGLDVAIVATPPTTHARIVGSCLRAGAHVLCEKPLGTTAREVEGMAAEAQCCGRVLMMASKFRFVPAVQQLRARIAAGDLGEVILCRVAFVSRVEMAGRMNAAPALSGGGVLMDNGPHALDLARFLAGPLRDARASLWPQAQELEVEDGVSLRFGLAEHRWARGEASLSWSGVSTSEIFAEVSGTRAGGCVRWSDYSRAQAFAAQWQHFAQAARGFCEPLVSSQDALENARAIEAAYASLGPPRLGD